MFHYIVKCYHYYPIARARNTLPYFLISLHTLDEYGIDLHRHSRLTRHHFPQIRHQHSTSLPAEITKYNCVLNASKRQNQFGHFGNLTRVSKTPVMYSHLMNRKVNATSPNKWALLISVIPFTSGQGAITTGKFRVNFALCEYT